LNSFGCKQNGDDVVGATCPVGIAQYKECDSRKGGDRCAPTAGSSMRDVGTPVVSKDEGRSGSGGVAKVTDVHSSGDAMGMDGHHVSRDCDVSDLRLDVKSGGERHLPPNVQRIEDVVVEDDGFSWSELGPQVSPLVKREPEREKRLDARVSYCEQTYWRCSHCGGLNSPTARCGTCRRFEDRNRTSETVLLERTRFELLNGRDFWICTACEIAMPSLTAPCGGCRKMISFVPLEIGEFEEFVRKQRETGAFSRLGPVREKEVLKSPGSVV
jgi:hypothetical protein